MEALEALKYWSQFGHPLFMWLLFATTFYALYLGIQSRRIRSATGEAKTKLVKGKFSQKHHRVGALILAVMVLGNLGGMAVTYINNGKLFLGPHLLAGLGMTGLISVSAALTPQMQKGEAWARNTHIAVNGTIVILFGWQAVTGMEIIQKILSN
jgi:MFS family permease